MCRLIFLSVPSYSVSSAATAIYYYTIPFSFRWTLRKADGMRLMAASGERVEFREGERPYPPRRHPQAYFLKGGWTAYYTYYIVGVNTCVYVMLRRRCVIFYTYISTYHIYVCGIPWRTDSFGKTIKCSEIKYDRLVSLSDELSRLIWSDWKAFFFLWSGVIIVIRSSANLFRFFFPFDINLEISFWQPYWVSCIVLSEILVWIRTDTSFCD